MKRSWLVFGALALTLASILPDDAFARVGVGRVGVGRVGVARVGVGRVGVVRGAYWRGGVGVARGAYWRRGYGWPVAAGIAAAAGIGYASYAYSNSCVAWDGWRWVNVCYQSYPYGYAGYGYGGYGYGGYRYW